MQRKAHQRASLCLEREAIFSFALRLMRGSFLMPVMSGEWRWTWPSLLGPSAEGRIALCPLSHYAWWKVSLKGRLVFFFSSLRTAIFQNVQSPPYIRKDVMVISVPYECPTWEISLLCLFHAQYDTLYIMIIWPLPVAFNCRQLLKVRADRRKNGRLRKYHYSKIQNAGDYASSPAKVSSYLPSDNPFASRPSKFIISTD